MENKNLLKILFIEDRPEDVELAIRELKKEDLIFDHKVVETKPDLIKVFNEFKPDIIISDYSMPVFDGMSALKTSLSFNEHIPFIILTGSIDEETAVNCMKAGANDYVLKQQIKRLPFAVKEALVKNRAIKENIQITKDLRESKERFELAMKATKDGVFDWNILEDTVYLSPGWKSMLGYEYDELPNEFHVWEDLCDPEGLAKTRALIEDIITGKIDHYDINFKMRHKKGHWIDILARAKAIYNEQGEASRLIGTHVDISELKQIQKNLSDALIKAQESDRLKSAFLANMSHEIRTPMNGILGFTTLLKQEDLDTEKQKEYIRIIQLSGKRMLNTINDLIDISRIESGQVKINSSYVNINDQFEHLYQFFKPEAMGNGLDLTYETPLENDKAQIFTDKEKFFAVLNNYLKNAMKYTKQGRVHFGYEVKKQDLVFFVRDSGIGIKQDKLNAVFERFVQADFSLSKPYEGSGLGLAISKAYAEMIGGKVWVESQFGKGSTFYLQLPLDSNKKSIEPSHKKNTLLNSTSFLKELNIMVVEDDEASILYMEILLKEKCAELKVAKTGSDAIQIAKDNPGLDLILMDVRMPDMDGYSATKIIRKFNEDILIIAQTAFAMESDRLKAMEAGCNAYISKPIHEEELLITIRNLLKK